jgi:CheY-like chemotaxis protein
MMMLHFLLTDCGKPEDVQKVRHNRIGFVRLKSCAGAVFRLTYAKRYVSNSCGGLLPVSEKHMLMTASHISLQTTILVVDDDAGVLRFVNAVLVEGNYIVLTDTNGTNALQQSREYKNEIDLLSSDFQMPGMTGVELANQMMLDRPGLTCCRTLLNTSLPPQASNCQLPTGYSRACR